MICNYLIGLAVSAHLNTSIEFNEIHPHGRLECGNYISGVYLNSFEIPSIYAGFEHALYKDLNIEYGIVNGYYGLTEKGIIPFLKFNYGYYFVTPTLNENNDIALTIGIEYFLGE